MTSATAAAAAKVTKPKKAKTVSHAKQEQTALPLPTIDNSPEFGKLDPAQIIVRQQVRTEFDEESLRELASDIADRGILQPLTVRKTVNGFVLVAGERRLRAAKLAGLQSVPVLVVQMSDAQHHAAQLAENIQREDLSLADEATKLKELHNELKSVKAVAELVHKSVGWVSKRISLAEGLGHYASSLMADGITEDIELLQAVDKLDRATPGTNTAWALCEKIRKGEAGRTEAREALKRVTEERKPKPKPTEKTLSPEEVTRKAHEQEMQLSSAFRYWLNHSHPWISMDYIQIFAATLADDKAGILHDLEITLEMEKNLTNRRVALENKLKAECSVVAEKTGPMVQHQAFVQYRQSKQQPKDQAE